MSGSTRQLFQGRHAVDVAPVFFVKTGLPSLARLSGIFQEGLQWLAQGFYLAVDADDAASGLVLTRRLPHLRSGGAVGRKSWVG